MSIKGLQEIVVSFFTGKSNSRIPSDGPKLDDFFGSTTKIYYDLKMEEGNNVTLVLVSAIHSWVS